MKSGTVTKKQSLIRTPTLKEMEARFRSGIILGFIFTVASYYLDGLLSTLMYGFAIGTSAIAFLGKYHYDKIIKQIVAAENTDAKRNDRDSLKNKRNLANTKENNLKTAFILTNPQTFNKRMLVMMSIGSTLISVGWYMEGLRKLSLATAAMFLGVTMLIHSAFLNYVYRNNQAKKALPMNTDDSSSPADTSDALEDNLSHQPDLANKEKALAVKYKAPVPRLAGFRRRDNAANKTPHKQTSRSWNPLHFLWSNTQVKAIKPLENLDEVKQACDNDASFSKPAEKKPQPKAKKNKVRSVTKPQTHLKQTSNVTVSAPIPLPSPPSPLFIPPSSPKTAADPVAIEQPTAFAAINSTSPQETKVDTTPPATLTSSSTLDVLKSLESPSLLPTENSVTVVEDKIIAPETTLAPLLLAELAQEREQRVRDQAELAQKQEELVQEREQHARDQAELTQKQKELAQEREQHARHQAELTQKQEQLAAAEQQRAEYARLLVQLTSSVDAKVDVKKAEQIVKDVAQIKILARQKRARVPNDGYSRNPKAYTANQHLDYLVNKLVSPELPEDKSNQTTSPALYAATSSLR